MDPLASITSPAVAAPSIPTAWISSGAVTPVGGSPAAAAPTAWSPQPAWVDPAPQASLIDAIANRMLGIAPQAVPTRPSDAAQAQQQLAMQAAMPPLVPVATSSAPATVAAPPATMSAPATVSAPATTSAPVTVSAPAAGALAAPAPVAAPPAADPTLVGSVTGALAGFASATGRAVEAVGGVAGAGVSRARQAGTELWAGVRNPRSIHVSQVPSKYNAAPASGNRDCGPASVVMTLKLLGKSIPGAAGSASPQRLINRVRQLAGNVANTASTTNHELARALTAAGTKTREIADAVSIRQAVLAGKPVILNGNPRRKGSYGPSFNASQMTPYDGAHWIVVSGFDSKAGKFIINDPLSKVGPVKVSPAQLEAYRGGSLGIEVAA